MSTLGGSRMGNQIRVPDAIYVADEAARLALSGLRDGQLVVQIDDNSIFSWDAGGSAWVPTSGLSASGIDDTDSVDLTVTAGVLTAEVKPAGVDHDQLDNTHNLTTDINHDELTNTHNLTTDINHDELTNYSSDQHFTQADISTVGTVATGSIDGGDSNG